MGDNVGFAYHNPRANLLFKFHQILSHVNGVFSKFSKFIAPAYHHERCERSVHMRLYSMNKREFVVTFALFFVAFGFSLFVGLAGPPITRTVEQRISELLPHVNQSYIATGPFLMKSPALTSYAQQLWMIAKIDLDHKEEQYFKKDFLLKVSLEGIGKNNQKFPALRGPHFHTRNESLNCGISSCNEFRILHLGFIDYTHFILSISFQGLESVLKWATIKDVIFYFKTYNPSFTKLEIWIRFVFLLSSFVMSAWFAHSLRKYPVYDWAIEQKWLSILLPLLLLCNDPLFPMIFLVDSWIPAFLDTVFQMSFLCAILIFWLSIYHGLRQNERKFYNFYLPKILIVSWIWMSAVIVATLQKYNELKDPLFSTEVESDNFYNFKVAFFIGGAVYALYLIYLMIAAYSELRTMPYFDVRLKFVTLSMAIVVCITVIITAFQFGVGALEDNFVSKLSTNYNSSAEFMAFYALFNFYLFTCAFVYSSSDKHFVDNHILKDNPALSMINDSDEDVIYASDDDTRKPLNRGSNDNEESD